MRIALLSSYVILQNSTRSAIIYHENDFMQTVTIDFA